MVKIISLHNKLNPKIWDNGRLQTELQFHLLKIAMEFIKFINIPNLKLQDVTLSGSNASFNYNDKSDIDLHLVVNRQNECYKLLQELFLSKKSLFNEQHDISIRGINVEVYVQESDQPHISNGIFSVIRNEWIKKPKKITVNPDKTNVKHKYKFMKFEIQQAIDSKDVKKLQSVKDMIKKMRQSGLEKNGEYGPENLAFKVLRNNGLLDKLYTSFTKAQDSELSIK
jgi:hypothetical protein